MLFGSSQRRIIAIDPSGSSVKIAQILNRGKKSPLIEGFFYEKISDNAQIKTFLSTVIPKLDLKRSQVVIVLHGIQTIYRLLEMPILEGVELEKAINYEEEVYIPFPAEDRVVDYKIVSEEGNRLVVALAGARKTAVIDFVSPFTDMGIPLASAEISGLCLSNLFSLSAGDEKNTIVLLDVGARFTTFVIVAKGVPVIIREISIGGDLFTEHIEDILHISKDEAELLKCNPGDKEGELKTALEPIFYRFAEEIKVSMEYTGQMAISKPSEVYISGGGGRTPGLIEYLEKSLGLPIRQWEVLSSFEIGKGVDRDSLGVRKDMIHACLGAGVV